MAMLKRSWDIPWWNQWETTRSIGAYRQGLWRSNDCLTMAGKNIILPQYCRDSLVIICLHTLFDSSFISWSSYIIFWNSNGCNDCITVPYNDHPGILQHGYRDTHLHPLKSRAKLISMSRQTNLSSRYLTKKSQQLHHKNLYNAKAINQLLNQHFNGW